MRSVRAACCRRSSTLDRYTSFSTTVDRYRSAFLDSRAERQYSTVALVPPHLKSVGRRSSRHYASVSAPAFVFHVLGLALSDYTPAYHSSRSALILTPTCPPSHRSPLPSLPFRVCSSKIRHRTPARVRRSPGLQCTPPQQHPSRHESPQQVRDVRTASVERQVRSAIMPSSLTYFPTHQRSHIKLYYGSPAPPIPISLSEPPTHPTNTYFSPYPQITHPPT